MENPTVAVGSVVRLDCGDNQIIRRGFAMSQESVLTIPETQIEIAEGELQMTFQVALIGSDGLIVGSDRRQVYSTPGTFENHGALQPGEICKFSKGPNEEIICAFAGGPILSRHRRCHRQFFAVFSC